MLAIDWLSVPRSESLSSCSFRKVSVDRHQSRRDEIFVPTDALQDLAHRRERFIGLRDGLSYQSINMRLLTEPESARILRGLALRQSYNRSRDRRNQTDGNQPEPNEGLPRGSKTTFQLCQQISKRSIVRNSQKSDR